MLILHYLMFHHFLLFYFNVQLFDNTLVAVVLVPVTPFIVLDLILKYFYIDCLMLDYYNISLI